MTGIKKYLYMRDKLLLVGIILLASLLRLWLLGVVPNSLYWDEVSLGYNAFSIAETLRDEHGHLLPVLFEAFGDYKMPAYIYLTAVFVKLFGLSEFSVRIGSALMGIITVAFLYFLTKEILLLIKTNAFIEKNRVSIALVSSLFFALSPWHIQFSRTGYEANGGLFCVVIAVYLFLKGIRNNPKLLIFSSLFFVLSCYFYRSILMFTPVLLCVFLLVFFRELFIPKIRKYTIIAAVSFVLLAYPIFHASFLTEGSSRADDVLVFSNLDEKVSLFQMWAIQSGEGRIGNIIYNERMIYFNEIVSNYLSHFSPSFLFTSGDPNPRHSTRNMGMEYIWELPLILIGLLVLARSRGKGLWVLFSWLILAPLSAAISIFAPHALRSLNMIPILSIFGAIGAVYLYYWTKPFMRIPYAVVGLLVIGFFVFGYLFNYYKVSTFLTATDWGDGYKQMNQYVLDNYDEYDKIIISGHYWQPYAYTLFYSKYSPEKFQENGDNYSFDKFYFGGTSWIKEGPPELGSADLYKMSENKKTLVILSPQEYSEQKNPPGLLEEIKDMNNKVVFFVGIVQKPRKEVLDE
jgi:4-amino-4-deoxy-L-arabinose transferase-like glycosyltransferase